MTLQEYAIQVGTFVNHNSMILIQSGLVIIFALFAIYFLNLVVSGGKVADGSSDHSIEKLEESLKKVLEQTSGLGAGVSLTQVSGEGISHEAQQEIEKLQNELTAKADEIRALQEAANDGASSGDDVDPQKMAEYESKLKELEAKLQEYEIIEDEIADLSMFKEENQKLKDEIEALKAGGATASPSPTSASIPQSAPTSIADDEDDASADTSDFEAKDMDAASLDQGAIDSMLNPGSADEGGDEEGETSDAEAEAMATAKQSLKGQLNNEDENYITEEVVNEFNQAVKEDVYGIKEPDTAADDDAEEDFFTDDILAEFSAAVEADMGQKVEETEAHAAASAQSIEDLGGSSDDLDGQAEIDAMMAQAEADAAAELESQTADEETVGEMDGQAEIDAMMAQAEADATAELEAQGLEAEASEDLDGQDAIDAMMADAKKNLGSDAPAQGASTKDESTISESTNVDTDKMLAEMEGLEELDVDGGSALEEDADIDKMAQEASSLSSDS